MPTTTAERRTEKRSEYVNRTQGHLGVIKINRKGEDVAMPVAPGERVFLTEEEVALTAEAHVRREDSPFELRTIIHFDPMTGEETERFESPPLELQVPKRRRRTRAEIDAAAAPDAAVSLVD